MTTLREAAQMALDLLGISVEGGTSAWSKKANATKEVLRAALAQPQREWQGLTDEEIGNIIEASQITLKNYCSEDKQTEYARAIEQTLREKNT
jgi:hypothetical protein